LQLQRAFGYDYLTGIQGAMGAQGLAVNIESRVGAVADTILAVATACGAGLIAMATHGRSGIQRLSLGSVSDRVAHRSTLPVLLVRPAAEGAPAGVAIDHILLPLDGSEPSEAALPMAQSLAIALKVPVTVLRTVSFTWYTWGITTYDGMDMAASVQVLNAMQEEAERYTEGIVARLAQAGASATAQVLQGSPAEAIADTAAAPGTLVVMSSHGRAGLGRTLLGSVTDQVVRNSGVPVVIVRPGSIHGAQIAEPAPAAAFRS
jgi:nucleotide-binding universal stress UspA family protein